MTTGYGSGISLSSTISTLSATHGEISPLVGADDDTTPVCIYPNFCMFIKVGSEPVANNIIASTCRREIDTVGRDTLV
jgi:hypothetical protein